MTTKPIISIMSLSIDCTLSTECARALYELRGAGGETQCVAACKSAPITVKTRAVLPKHAAGFARQKISFFFNIRNWILHWFVKPVSLTVNDSHCTTARPVCPLALCLCPPVWLFHSLSFLFAFDRQSGSAWPKRKASWNWKIQCGICE